MGLVIPAYIARCVTRRHSQQQPGCWTTCLSSYLSVSGLRAMRSNNTGIAYGKSCGATSLCVSTMLPRVAPNPKQRSSPKTRQRDQTDK